MKDPNDERVQQAPAGEVGAIKMRITNNLEQLAIPNRYDAEQMKQLAQRLPIVVDGPIMLLSERLAHFAPGERDALYALAPALRDLRGGLAVLYQMRCDDTAVLLTLADHLGDAHLKVMQNLELRDDFSEIIRVAFQAARANVWALLQQTHKIDIAETAQANTGTPGSITGTAGAAAKSPAPRKSVSTPAAIPLVSEPSAPPLTVAFAAPFGQVDDRFE